MQQEALILPAREFDSGTKTASADVQTFMHNIVAAAAQAGLDIAGLIEAAQSASASEAQAILQRLHDAATILFLRWQCTQQSHTKLQSLAIARIFNGITQAARDLDRCHNLIDKSHLDELKHALAQEFLSDTYDPATTAQLLKIAASAHRHERAWAWVVLPTFARQPYGRILLFKLEIPDSKVNVFVTQPFFVAEKVTLFHTHGRNWAFSRPLGQGKNTHINTLWIPRSAEEPFPLVLDDFSEYDPHVVAVMPPRTIHGISRKRPPHKNIPSLTELIQNKSEYRELLAETRFGELACMHIYRPDMALVKQLDSFPLLKDDERFFIENDMIVFDHFTKSIWAGGGGSWPRRMIEFGTRGDHCGICYENDPRRENLDAKIVTEWLVKKASVLLF